MENRSMINKKIVFFVKSGLDNFLQDVIDGLSDEYETRKIIATEYKQIDEGMKWADICWFEWCDELVAYGSKLDMAQDRKIVCRLHSYEAFTDYITQVNWSNVDKLICVGEFIRNLVLKKTDIDKEKTDIIPNGIDIDKYNYKERGKGFNIAYAGYINFKKGPMLLLQAFKSIYDMDSRYKLHIAGVFQEERYVLYFTHMIKEMGLQGSVGYDGWQDDLDMWFEDKNYILCTSLLESQNVSVMQAMSKGIKPLVHNFPGAGDIYPSKYLWNTAGEAAAMIGEDSYDSKEYRQYIEENYSLSRQIMSVKDMLRGLHFKEQRQLNEKPLVTVGLINYNYKRFLDKSVMSVLNQEYDNIELLIVDDFSTDGSREKIEEYEEMHKSVRAIYHVQNSGSAVLAFKEIIESAKGQYLIFLSADDYFFDNQVIMNYVYEIVSDKELDYVYGNLALVDNEGNYKETWRYRDYSDNEIVNLTFRKMGSGVIPLTTGMFKTEFFRRNSLGFTDDPDNRVAGDTLNTLIYLKHGWKRKYVDTNSLCYRQHGSNMTYDVKSRIKSIISVMEYAANNFDAEIIFPEIKWERCSGDVKEAVKMYVTGEYYWKTLSAYYNGEIKILGNDMALDKEQLREYVQPLIGVGEKYLDKSIEKSELLREMADRIKPELSSVKIQYPEISSNPRKNEIFMEGQKLRKALLSDYDKKYKGKNLKVLIYAPSNGNWKYGFAVWKDILDYMGVETEVVYDIKDSREYSEFNMFINIADESFITSVLKNKSLLDIPHKIGIASKQDFFTSSQYTKQDLVNIDLIKSCKYDFLVSPYSANSIKDVFKEWIERNIDIKSSPFGFNPLIHYPEEAREIYDYFFVGTNSYSKVSETNKYLLPILSSYRGILRGSNWGADIPELHPNNCRFFYNRSRINLNYHLLSQKEYENEINERTFVISACGGFQLIDNPVILNRYYSEKEMAVANYEKEYIDKFIYYLNKPDERHEMAYNALVKTYHNKYSLFHRLEKILKCIL